MGVNYYMSNKYYTFIFEKDNLPKKGKYIDWVSIDTIQIYCLQLNKTYKFNVVSMEKNTRGELYILLSYNNKLANKPIRVDAIKYGKLSNLFKQFGIIEFLTVGNSIVKEKICTECTTLKSISEFNACKEIKDGYKNTYKEYSSNRRKKYIKKCIICEKTFNTSDDSAKFCSRTCAGISRRNRIDVECSYCNKIKI